MLLLGWLPIEPGYGLMENDNAKIINRCHFLVTCISIVIILLSLSIIAGSFYHITLLTSISPDWVNMKINTAICFLLSGMALLLLNNQNRNTVGSIIFVVMSLTILLISGLTIIEYVAFTNVGIDEFLLKETLPLPHDTFSAGRMSFITALDFILISTAFLLSLKKNISIWILQTIAWLILLSAFASFLNYLHGANITYAFAKYSMMAVYTIFLFFLMSIGLLLTKPQDGIVGIILGKNNSGYLLRRIIPIPFVLSVSLTYLIVFFEKEKIIDSFSVDVLIQVVIFIITGLMILIVALILKYKEKQLSTTEAQIQHNEMIFRQFAENIDIVFYTTSPDLSEIQYVSPAYEEIWGRSTESLYKNPREWFEAIVPEDKPIAQEAFFINFPEEKVSAAAEYRIQRPDGTVRYIFARIHRVKDEKNNIFCLIGIAVDMTNVTLEKIYKQLQYHILRLIENEKTIEAFSPKLLQLMCHSLNFDLGEFWFLDPTTNRLRCVDTWHKEGRLLAEFDLKSRQQTLSITDDFSGKIWKTRLPLWMSRYSENNVYMRSKAAGMAGLGSALGIPVIYHNQIYGVIEFFSADIREPEPALLTMMENIGKSIGEFAERFQDREKIKDIARHDLLTGLLNRSALETDLDLLIAGEKTISIAVMVLDIDRFKLINEAFGHGYGDILLKTIASRLGGLSGYKKINLSRLGADKFILYLPNTNRKEAYDFARIIQSRFSEPFELAENKVTLTASIGIALYPQNGLDGKTLVINADLAVVEAKKYGGNRIYVFAQQLAVIASKTIVMDTELRRAILDNQFTMLYQPQIDLVTGRICAAEALVRWQHPVNGLMLPNEFIPFAEKNNLIVTLNEQIIRMTFQKISDNWSGVPLSINISAQQFQEGFHLVDYLESMMKEFSVSAKHIELEITENMLIQDTEHNIAVVTALNQLGFHIAIDDFGTGFSSFGYLKRLPIHKIKIDKSFVTGLPENEANAKIVRAIISMAHSLGKVVAAEGAETKAEVDFLKQEKCDIVQGFYYYKPMPFDEFTNLIKKGRFG